jgi:hypothetical protein
VDAPRAGCAPISLVHSTAKIEVHDPKSLNITTLTLHFFEAAPVAWLSPRQKEQDPQPVARHLISGSKSRPVVHPSAQRRERWF